MFKFTKKCQNCHLDVDIDPSKPISLCPYCGKELLYSVEETKQSKLAGSSVEEISNTSNEKMLLPKTNNEISVFTTKNSENKYKRIAIGLAVVLFLFLGYFGFNYFKSVNTQSSISQNANYETTANNIPFQKTTVVPTNTLAPTATPIKQIKAPALAEKFVGMDYEDVVKNFKNAGFKNIETKPLKDMIIDIGASHVGDVKSISIRGNIDYDTETLYNETDAVIIYYHSLK